MTKEYLAISLQRPLRQQDGFFADREGQVFFWPTKAAPGFVMTPALFKETIEAKAAYDKTWSRFLLIAIAVYVAGTFIVRQLTQLNIIPPVQADGIPPNDIHVITALVYMIFICLPISVVRDRAFKRALGKRLAGETEAIGEDRPPAMKIKPSGVLGRPKLLLLFGLALFFVLVTVSYLLLKAGQPDRTAVQTVMFCVAAACTFLIVWLIYGEIRFAAPDTVPLYEQPEADRCSMSEDMNISDAQMDDLRRAYGALSDGDKSVLIAGIEQAGSLMMTSKDSANDQFWTLLAEFGWTETGELGPEFQQPGLGGMFAGWKVTETGKRAIPALLRKLQSGN